MLAPMLQVITGMYFRDVPLHETEHRRPLYTNAWLLGRDEVDLPVGRLITSTERMTVNTAIAQFVERIEAVRPDGSDEFMISTGGDDILEDLAVVLSFALNLTFTGSREKADRLIREPSTNRHDPNPANILPRVAKPNVVVQEWEIEDLTTFMSALISLRRPVFERAMTAMRRIVTASERVAEDPTLAYTDYVAALESLTSDGGVPAPEWIRLHPRSRKILDPVLGDLKPEDAEKVRSAILESERAGVKHRYVEFVMDHVRPSFYRSEAAGALGPVTGPQLRKVVEHAYTVRSESLHELREVAVQSWLMVDGARTVSLPGGQIMLTHEGLNQLARHVVRTFVARGSTELDSGYAWHDHLPNVMQVELAPELYMGYAENMTPKGAAKRASDFVEMVNDALAGRRQLPVDMRPALERIEQLLPTQHDPQVRRPMLAIYLLWHVLLPESFHLPSADDFLDTARDELSEPSLWAFAVSAVLGLEPDWELDDWCELAEQRWEAMHARRPAPAPLRLDAALWARTAVSLQAVGAVASSLEAVGNALQCEPGDAELIKLEEALQTGSDYDFEVRRYVVGALAEDSADADDGDESYDIDTAEPASASDSDNAGLGPASGDGAGAPGVSWTQTQTQWLSSSEYPPVSSGCKCEPAPG